MGGAASVAPWATNWHLQCPCSYGHDAGEQVQVRVFKQKGKQQVNGELNILNKQNGQWGGSAYLVLSLGLSKRWSIIHLRYDKLVSIGRFI